MSSKIRVKIYLLTVFCLGVSGLFIYSQSKSPEAKTESVVLITSSGCRSAETRTVGTFIEGGYFLTVAHGVVGQSSNRITTSSGGTFDALVAAIDIDQDVALLELEQPTKNQLFKPVVLGQANAGANVVFVAFDETKQFTRKAKIKRRLKINTQDIYRRKKVTRPGLEVELKIEVGNSGAPLLNDSGELVGILWATSRLVDNRSWATRSDVVSKLLSEAISNTKTSNDQRLACTG